MTVSAVNDVTIKIGTVNGTGSASANGLLMKAIFPHGHPGRRQELLPLEHPGTADLVRNSGHRRTATRRGLNESTS